MKQIYKKTARLALMFALAATICASEGAFAANPTATAYGAAQCEGSYMPYPEPDAKALARLAVPDSLEAVMVNHVGRHGSRFPSSAKHIEALKGALQEAAKGGTLTPLGKKLQALCGAIERATAGRWGALDSLGLAEQRALASRMAARYPGLLADGAGRVEAMASYSPRCIMSMYEFCHQLSRLDNRLEVATTSGRQNSTLMRPFDNDADYAEYRESKAWEIPLGEEERRLVTLEPLKRVLGAGAPVFEADNSDEAARLALAEYAVVAGAEAAGLGCHMQAFFKPDEMNALWAVGNLKRYLQYSASTLSMAPAEMASALLLDLIDTTDAAAQGLAGSNVKLRFGHAETLMPLLALMRLQGCYYMTNYFDTVATHWRDFDIVPMAANLQLVLLRKPSDGRLYLRVDLNERPVPLLPGRSELYTPWEQARDYLTRCLPLLMQP